MASVAPSPVAPDAKAPLGPEAAFDPTTPENMATFDKLKRWTLDSLQHLANWRKDEAEASYAFYSGDQWTAEERRIFEGDGRVAPIFNLTGINVDAVCGLEVNNRQDVKYLPRTQGDVKVNELLSSAAMWVRDQAQAEDEESDAFKDATITGLGVTETRRPDGETISVDRRDPTECFYDVHAKKPNLVDRRFGGRVIMMDTDEAVGMFPGFPIEVLNAKWALNGVEKSGDGIERLDYPDTSAGSNRPKPKKVCMVEIEWFDYDGKTKVYKQAFLGNTSLIEINPLEAWAYNWITGKRDKGKNQWYGIVRALRDPQKLVNKFLATTTHILATNAKGGLLYETGAFVDQRLAEKDWSNPQKNVEVAQGALAAGRIQPRVAPPLPSGAIQLMDFALNNIRSVSGINTELLGAAERDQPASLEMQRRQSAVTILASLFDAKRRYHKEQGRTLLALMKALDPMTLVRVTIDPTDEESMMATVPPGTPPEQVQQMMAQAQQEKQREAFVQFSMVSRAFSNPSIKFDVIVDEAPSSPNQQQETIAKIQMLAGAGMEIPPQIQAIVAENIGLPSTIADEFAKAIGGGGDPRVEQLTQQLQQGAQVLQQTQAELEAAKTDKRNDTAKLKIDAFRADTERMKVEGELRQGAMGAMLGDMGMPQ